VDKQTLYEDIRQQIADERLQPGQWLVERDLCNAYGMSRTPIREVLWKLTADGLLDHEPNKGFAVQKLSLEQIFEVFQAREAIEGMSARLACRKGDEAFRDSLRDMREELARVNVDGDAYQAILLGRKLHQAINETARNNIMAEIYHKLQNLTILTINLTKQSPFIETVSREAHIAIIDALIEQDEDRCERAMREHLKDTCREVVEQFYPGMLSGAGYRKSGNT
jgi:DNA-binding GntR family transcriptional regulator